MVFITLIALKTNPINMNQTIEIKKELFQEYADLSKQLKELEEKKKAWLLLLKHNF